MTRYTCKDRICSIRERGRQAGYRRGRESHRTWTLPFLTMEKEEDYGVELERFEAAFSSSALDFEFSLV